jgi:hypothetical protein
VRLQKPQLRTKANADGAKTNDAADVAAALS